MDITFIETQKDTETIYVEAEHEGKRYVGILKISEGEDD